MHKTMPGYRVRRNKHGKGLYATRAYALGENILTFRGPLITYAHVLRKRKPDNAFQISRNRYIDLRQPGVLANHSCSPNAGVTPELQLIAIKPIKAGDEITYDYSACMDKDTECEFRCACGAPRCRRVIRGFKKLPTSLKRLYRRLDVVQSFLTQE